jgi:hypothetical protein
VHDQSHVTVCWSITKSYGPFSETLCFSSFQLLSPTYLLIMQLSA